MCVGPGTSTFNSRKANHLTSGGRNSERKTQANTTTKFASNSRTNLSAARWADVYEPTDNEVDFVPPVAELGEVCAAGGLMGGVLGCGLLLNAQTARQISPKTSSQIATSS